VSILTLTYKGKQMISNPQNSLLRVKQVLEKIPVSRTTWWQGVKDGKFPQPVKLGPRTTAWRASDIDALINRLGA
jgi:prophage regulatory protein